MRLRMLICTIFALLPVFAFAGAKDKKIVLIAGTPSHGPGEHEFNAGTTVLTDCLNKVKGVQAIMVKGGWPADESVFDGADAVVFYMDGGNNHPMIRTPERMAKIKSLMQKGVGLCCLHYAVEFPKGVVGNQILEWLGGYYETDYSTNPHNDVLLTPKAGHPIANGVKPFQCRDEWYYRIRFTPGDTRVTPVLTAILPKDSTNVETTAWATERADGGRSFGFTGGHAHTNWGIADFRKLVMNAICWSAKIKIPKNGIESTVTTEQLTTGLDVKK
ncbi:MAG: ThuA domain-containing protein [Chthonomonadales bacterium]